MRKTAVRGRSGNAALRLISRHRRALLAAGTVLACGGFILALGKSGALEARISALRETSLRLTADAGFSVRNVYVEGRKNTERDVLRAILSVERGDPLFAFDPVRAKAGIEKVSWVREAHVERRFPDTIHIVLKEREPVALWQHRGKVRLIDADGVVLTDTLSPAFKDYPILVGEQAPEHARRLLAYLKAEPDVFPHVLAAKNIGGRRWDLTLSAAKNKDKDRDQSGSDGAAPTLVRLPEDAAPALQRLAEAQRDERILDKGLAVIDLREPGRLVVRTAPGMAEAYRAQSGVSAAKAEAGTDAGNPI